MVVINFVDRKNKINYPESKLTPLAFYKVGNPCKEPSVKDVNGLNEKNIWCISDAFVFKNSPAIARGCLNKVDIENIVYDDGIKLFLELDDAEPLGRHYNIKPDIDYSDIDSAFFTDDRARKLADISHSLTERDLKKYPHLTQVEAETAYRCA